MTFVPPSVEVVAEEIEVALAECGLPREEQGEIVHDMVRATAQEFVALWQSFGPDLWRALGPELS